MSRPTSPAASSAGCGGTASATRPRPTSTSAGSWWGSTFAGAGSAGRRSGVPAVDELWLAGADDRLLVLVLRDGRTTGSWSRPSPSTSRRPTTRPSWSTPTDLGLAVAVHPRLATEVPASALVERMVARLDVAGARRGPPVVDPSDPRIEVRQLLADRLGALDEPPPPDPSTGAGAPPPRPEQVRSTLIGDLRSFRGRMCTVRPLDGWGDVLAAHQAGWEPIATVDEVGVVLVVFDTPHGLADDTDFDAARSVLTRFNATALVVLAAAVSDTAEAFDSSSLNYGIDAPSGRHTAPRPLISGLAPFDAIAKFLDQSSGTRMAAPPSRGPVTRVDVDDILREAAGAAAAEPVRQGSEFRILPKRRGYESIADAQDGLAAALARAFGPEPTIVQDLLRTLPDPAPMIRHIALENWRAYRSLDIDVLPGTTFLVAPNGVGKSSLLEAVRWVLAAGNVEHRASMIRQGHKEATAAVTVDVARGQLVVARALRAKGARLTTETTATLDGHAVDEAEAVRLLEESWSADPRFVSRTAFLTEDLRRDAEEPNLRTHLCRAYSLDDLQRAVAEIEPVLSQLSKGLKASRAELSATEEQLRTAEEELAALGRAGGGRGRGGGDRPRRPHRGPGRPRPGPGGGVTTGGGGRLAGAGRTPPGRGNHDRPRPGGGRTARHHPGRGGGRPRAPGSSPSASSRPPSGPGWRRPSRPWPPCSKRARPARCASASSTTTAGSGPSTSTAPGSRWPATSSPTSTTRPPPSPSTPSASWPGGRPPSAPRPRSRRPTASTSWSRPRPPAQAALEAAVGGLREAQLAEQAAVGPGRRHPHRPGHGRRPHRAVPGRGPAGGGQVRPQPDHHHRPRPPAGAGGGRGQPPVGGRLPRPAQPPRPARRADVAGDRRRPARVRGVQRRRADRGQADDAPHHPAGHHHGARSAGSTSPSSTSTRCPASWSAAPWPT